MSLVLFFFVIIGIPIGLGIVQYFLGKKNVKTNSGLIIPVIYFIYRIYTSFSLETSLFSAIFGGVIIAIAYYAIFNFAKKKFNP